MVDIRCIPVNEDWTDENKETHMMFQLFSLIEEAYGVIPKLNCSTCNKQCISQRRNIDV